MKLIDITSNVVVNLPDSLNWVDEMTWVPVVSSYSYSLTGALIMDTGTKKKGRPITLEPPSEDMGWLRRVLVEQLHLWAQTPARKMRLVLEYPDDKREFIVMFRHSETAIESKPVKGFPEPTPDAWYTIALRLIEVE
jgi:hypothetical protein